MRKNILFTQKIKVYQGRYIAVARNKVVASGKDAKDVFKLAKKILSPKKVEGIYYVPRKKDLLTALCVFHFSKQLGVGFNLLGRKSFFDRFHICFDDKHRFMELNTI